jgi:hypothetical protein
MAERPVTISSEREFIDTIYFYQVYKYISEKLDESDHETHRNAYERMVEHYISLITRCLQGISSNESNNQIQTEYINYFSWNEDVINTNLDEFKCKLQSQINKTPNEEKLLDEIKQQLDAIKQTKVKFLELDINELGKVNEYVQAFRIVKGSTTRRVNKRLIENLSYRFVDYLNTLTVKRCIIEGFGRNECNYDDLKAEAEFILTKLNEASNLACHHITKNAWEAFTSFREKDQINRLSQDEEIAAALDLSHVRANETRLHRLERQLKEACEKINTWLQKKLNETFQVVKIQYRTILDPVGTLKNLWFAIRHPINTKDALVKWIKQNKWKAGIIVVSGLAIGVAAGILIGGPVIVGALSMELTFGLAAGIATFDITGVMPLLAAAGEGGVLVRDADKKTQDEISKNAIEKQKVLDEVEPLKRKVRNEEFIRERIRTARQEAERELVVIMKAEEESAAQLDQELSKMSPEQIAPALEQCQEAIVLVTNELAQAGSTRERVISKLNDMRRDHKIINDAQSAAIRIQNRAKDSFTDIGTAKRIMNLEEMDIEAQKSDFT